MLEVLAWSVLANVLLMAGLATAVLGWRRASRSAAREAHHGGALESHYEAVLRDAQAELERTRRARTTFLAATNHDLRQPLQAIACFSAILAQRLRGPLRDVVGNLQTSVGVLTSHIETLADLSRLDAGIYEARLSTCTVDALLRDAAAAHRAAAAEKGLRLSVVACGDAVLTDPLLLRRALGNIIANAVRFTREGGVVLGCRRRGGVIRIEVWDSGIGIPDEHLDRIFDEFYQVGNSQRDHRQGLGLGLAVVERLMRLMPGHRISVASRPGKGSVFAIELPSAGRAPRSAPTRDRLVHAA